VSEFRVSDGGMFKCSGDHSESRKKHFERPSRGTSPRHSEAQRMQSNMKASQYKRLKSHIKGSVGMSQLITLVFCIKRDAVIRVVVKT